MSIQIAVVVTSLVVGVVAAFAGLITDKGWLLLSGAIIGLAPLTALFIITVWSWAL